MAVGQTGTGGCAFHHSQAARRSLMHHSSWMRFFGTAAHSGRGLRDVSCIQWSCNRGCGVWGRVFVPNQKWRRRAGASGNR